MRDFYKLVARVLILSMIWMPFSIQAGMVGTDQIATSAQDQVNRDKIVSFVSRSDVASQFEALGLSASSAKDRVAAMTQDEVNRIAGQIDALPAGADSTGWWIAAVIVVGVLIWWIWYRK